MMVLVQAPFILVASLLMGWAAGNAMNNRRWGAVAVCSAVAWVVAVVAGLAVG